MREIRRYEAFDGTMFDSEKDCRDYERKEDKRLHDLFDERFEAVSVSDDIQNYVAGCCSEPVFRFTAFEGWDKVVLYLGMAEDMGRYYIAGDKEVMGQTYLLFTDTYWGYIVDPEVLRESMMRDADQVCRLV